MAFPILVAIISAGIGAIIGGGIGYFIDERDKEKLRKSNEKLRSYYKEK